MPAQGIDIVYHSIIDKLTTDIPELLWVHKWDNQLDAIEDGKSYDIPFPNAFVEITAPTQYTPLSQGWSSGNLIVTIHVGHILYDDQIGGFEENFGVYTYRDRVVKSLTTFQPECCGCMMKVGEKEDFSHTNMYHFMIDFNCEFLDNTGSKEVQFPTITIFPPVDIDIVPEVVINI